MEHLALPEAALVYHDRGWHPIPLPPRMKGPPPEGLTGYDGYDLSRGLVADEPWTGNNIGLRMSTEVIGLDIDVYRGGNVTLADLVTKLGPLPKTFISHNWRNDGGSGIRFFRVPNMPLWVATLAGIDIIQRSHRYAVVWPSKHPDGRDYDWWDQTITGPAETIPRADELPELPWEWIGHLSRAQSGDLTTHSKAVNLATLQEFLDAHPTGEAQSYATVIEQHFREQWQQGFSRHDSMQHCLTWAMEHVRAGVMGARQTIDLLADCWLEALDGDARRAELVSDLRTTEFEAMVRHAVGKANAKTDAELHKYHDDVVGVPMQIAPVVDLPQKLDADQQPDSIFLNWHEFAQRDAADRQWLVDLLWPEGRAIALWADAKEGKSELALWCAAKLAMGEDPWTGAATSPIDVAYFDYEMTEEDLDDRLSNFGFDTDRLEHLHYALLPPLHALDQELGGSELLEHVQSVQAEAVVIDTFTGAVDGEENSADTVRAFTRHTGLRLKRAGIAYLRIDHAGKQRNKGPRGTSAKQQDVDVTWSLRRTKDGVLLSCDKGSRLNWVPPVVNIDRHVDQNTEEVSYSMPIRYGWSKAALAKARELDALGIPINAGRPTIIKTFKAAGKKPGANNVLNDAINYRRTMTRNATNGTQQQSDSR